VPEGSGVGVGIGSGVGFGISSGVGAGVCIGIFSGVGSGIFSEAGSGVGAGVGSVGSRGSTLRGGAFGALGLGVSTLSGGPATDSVGWGVMLVSRVTTSRRAWVCVSVQGAIGVRGDGFWSALTMSHRLAMMVSVLELAGIGTWVGNHVSVSQMRVAQISHIHTWWQRYDSMAGPTYHPSKAWGGHVVRASGFSWASTRVPGGPRGVRLKSNVP
jgi:hypothetical protein